MAHELEDASIDRPPTRWSDYQIKVREGTQWIRMARDWFVWRTLDEANVQYLVDVLAPWRRKSDKFKTNNIIIG